MVTLKFHGSGDLDGIFSTLIFIFKVHGVWMCHDTLCKDVCVPLTFAEGPLQSATGFAMQGVGARSSSRRPAASYRCIILTSVWQWRTVLGLQ
jgi:hypothetical protein